MASEEKLSVEGRLELIQILNRLTNSQFQDLVFALNPPPGVMPPDAAARGDRVPVLLQWVENTGPGLARLQEVLDRVIGKESELPDSPNLVLHRYKRTNQAYTQDLGNGVTLTLMRIPAGKFMMGDSAEEQSDQDDRSNHLVKIPQFLMGRYLVTQSQWQQVASVFDRVEIDLDPDPSQFNGKDLPVEQVNWYQAVEFCNRLSARTGKNYHLPSEAQWEYACRAETETAYHYGDKITSELANYSGEVGQTTFVGNYPANYWGLHDMHGNVLEWCQDHWHDNYKEAPTDGSAWLSSDESEMRILRGGSWNADPRHCRSAHRDWFNPDDRYYRIGFRVCCSPPRYLP